MTPLAHARWFVDEDPSSRADGAALAEPRTLALLVAAVAMAGAWILATRHLPAAPLPLARLAPLVPRLLATTSGLSLAALAIDGKLLTPGIAHDGSRIEGALAAVELAVAVWLIVGVRLRAAAFALGSLIVASAVVVGPLLVLECGAVIVIALYLALARRSGAGHAGAARALRLALGGSLVLVALTEKLADPALTQAVIQDHPSLNVLSAAGLPIGEQGFVALAGAAEVFVGLVIASGAGSQLIALAALGPFVATVAVFGVPELVRHLPIYGVLSALVVIGSIAAEGAPQLATARDHRTAAAYES